MQAHAIVTLQPLQKPAIMTDVGMFAWLAGAVVRSAAGEGCRI